MVATRLLTLSLLTTLVYARVAPQSNNLAPRQENDDDDDNNNNNSNSNSGCYSAVQAARTNFNFCSNTTIISQLNTCLASFSDDDDENWEETYDEIFESLGSSCGGQTPTPGGSLSTISASVTYVTSGGFIRTTGTGVGSSGRAAVGSASATGTSSGNDDDDDGDDSNNNGSTTFMAATTMPTSSPTTTVTPGIGPTATASSGTSGNDTDDDDDNDNNNNTNSAALLHISTAGLALALLTTFIL